MRKSYGCAKGHYVANKIICVFKQTKVWNLVKGRANDSENIMWAGIVKHRVKPADIE